MPAAERAAGTLLTALYTGATRALLPIAWRSVNAKLARGGVPVARRRERLGHATQPRPDGPLVWFHAASVGESQSVLTLIGALADGLPHASFLVTSGTATSADLVARRMPPRCQHQFPPLDAPGPVDRFLAHWRPDAAIFVESELWPNTLLRSRAAGIRLALLNARMSDSSLQGWRRFPETARRIIALFDRIETQNRKGREDILSLGADPARVSIGGNLKSTSAPLPVDEALQAAMTRALGNRPIWVAASTHPGEEEQTLVAARRVLAQHPATLLILVPRHPERGPEIASLCRAGDFATLRRAEDPNPPGPETQVYLADTLGETGTWYALAPIVFLGGSLTDIGGHNPFEPARSGAAVLSGPHVRNFSETFEPLIAAGGAMTVETGADLGGAVNRWLSDPAALDRARTQAQAFAEGRQGALDAIAGRLVDTLGLVDA